MKELLAVLMLSLLAVFGVIADPLKKEQIPAGVKWLLHLDVENGLQSQIGGFLGDELGKRLVSPLAELKTAYDIQLDWRQFQSFTAFGFDFDQRADVSGVMMVRSRQDMPAMLDRLLAKFEESGGKGRGVLTKTKEDGTALYVLRKEVFGATGKGGVLVLSKSKAKLKEALDVLDGKGSNMAASTTFSAFPQAPASFFFLALADGFNSVQGLPPQARILKSSTGGQLVVGEKTGRVFLQLALSARDGEAAAQIQQVFQGLLALATLNQDNNKELARLAQSVKVSTNDTVVNVNIELPVTNVIAQVEGELKKRAR